MVKGDAARPDGRRGRDGRLIPDAYTRRARLAPAALAAAPAIVLAGGALTAIEDVGAILTFVLASGAIVLCGLVRGLGKAIEPSLWRAWGGPPTTKLLRWSGSTPQAVQERRHALLAQLLSEPMPTEAEERASPAAADVRYDLAAASLRDLTRDGSRFALVAEENADYGFRRNCLGLRPLALWVSALVLVVSLAMTAVQSDTSYLPAVLVAVFGLGVWTALVRPSWVEVAADRYALRLLETVETLTRSA